MDDTVYRQSAIDAVSRGCLEFRGIFAECEENLNELPPAQSDNGYSDGFTDGYKRGLTDAHEPDQQWIPCSPETMPKKTDYYLVQYTRKYCRNEMAVAFYSVEEARCDDDYTWEIETFSDIKEVIAWMPLPKPYEER